MRIEAKAKGRPPARHLGDVVRETGTLSGEAEWINNEIILKGLLAKNAADQAQRAAEGKSEKVNPYVTDAAKCSRRVVYSLRNEQEEALTTDSLMNFLVGHSVEEAMAAIFEMRGARIIREVRVEIPTPATSVSGRVDFLIEINDDTQSKAIVELKSTSSRAMGMMLRNGEQGKEDHRRQLNLYLHASRLGLLPDQYSHGYLVYIVKDGIKGEPVAHSWRVDYDEQQALDDLASLDGAKQLADANLVPPIPTGYSRSKFPCSYCGYRSLCWGS